MIPGQHPDRRPRSPVGLLLRRGGATIDPDELRAVATRLVPALTGGTLRICLDDDRIDGPVIEVHEDERRSRTPLRDLAEDMSDAGVVPTVAGMAVALRSWLAGRPVSDADAAAAGVAVLRWVDPGQADVGWQVVVRRGDVAVPWTPSAHTGSEDVVAIRAAAMTRAAAVQPELRVEGPVALWSHPEVPLLASATLAAPDRMLRSLGDQGLAVADVHVVVTPGRPLAVAVAGVAARLSVSSGEPCVRLPWDRIPALPWID